ncbi:hypothetical protein N134_03680 [Limosilactobacillus reuteri TD1]|uniref:Uncharacterized protein n=1 Tax=Limosilactobacillus reuteri TD1 TaxID=1358027 RepID=S5NRP0_LIMRT|nr:hypothetical protein N134_03680 [Limosilactobacillus reuteri TD1]OCW63230.1 hypothetical protein BBP10_06575 [Limosilactobacillus reuteri]OCW63548.1 hypothetical protein BBP12_06790 [Limosilactobacillus reuteri]OCW70473.1 hypothetical protein BBP14_10415 [Limosilactobacillus reuteri]OCW70882.1 hypothetical protein BBP13_04055 [Limosilactobacillus reuteri]
MKHFNWPVVALLGLDLYFQIFLVVAIKRLMQTLIISTLLSVLITFGLSLVLCTMILILIIEHENSKEKEQFEK